MSYLKLGRSSGIFSWKLLWSIVFSGYISLRHARFAKVNLFLIISSTTLGFRSNSLKSRFFLIIRSLVLSHTIYFYGYHHFTYIINGIPSILFMFHKSLIIQLVSELFQPLNFFKVFWIVVAFLTQKTLVAGLKSRLISVNNSIILYYPASEYFNCCIFLTH